MLVELRKSDGSRYDNASATVRWNNKCILENGSYMWTEVDSTL